MGAISNMICLVDVSDLFIFCSGARTGGGRFLLKIRRWGGGPGGGGARRVPVAKQGIFWSGAILFFFLTGPKRPPS